MTLLTDKNLGNMGKQGSKFSREKFVWEKREKNLVEVIENLVWLFLVGKNMVIMVLIFYTRGKLY